MSRTSSSRAPAVSSLDDPLSDGGGGGVLSFLGWVEKNQVTILVEAGDTLPP